MHIVYTFAQNPLFFNKRDALLMTAMADLR